MLRRILGSVVMLSVLLTLPAVAADSEPFLDAKNWNGLDKYWSVKDGTIVGSTEPSGINFNTFLCSGKEYQDFELSFKVRLKDGQGNSGVQIRSEILDKEKLAVKGPQCDIGDVYWGSLYGEHFGGMMKAADKEVVTKALKKGEFNDYRIKCVGKRVTIKLNGETTVDQDFSNLPQSGIIAWQLHGGGPMEVTFKDIQFKEIK